MPLTPHRVLPALLGAAMLIAAGCSNSGQAVSSSGVVPQAPINGAAISTATMSPSPVPSATASATPTPKPTAFPTYPGYINLYKGAVIGAPKMFVPTRGDAWPGTAKGTAGQPIDGISCNSTMVENMYHVHAFLGVLVNGKQYAVPDSIGMNGWGPLVNGFSNSAYCFYAVHTHDASGLIHMESASTQPLSSTEFTLGNLLHIWDQSLTSTGFAEFPGMTRVFVAPRPPMGSLYVSGYTEYTGDPYAIPFYSHTAVWIEVGPPWVEAAALPKIRFYIEY